MCHMVTVQREVFFLIYVLLKPIPVNWGFVYIVIISMDIPIKFLVKHFMLI